MFGWNKLYYYCDNTSGSQGCFLGTVQYKNLITSLVHFFMFSYHTIYANDRTDTTPSTLKLHYYIEYMFPSISVNLYQCCSLCLP